MIWPGHGNVGYTDRVSDEAWRARSGRSIERLRQPSRRPRRRYTDPPAYPNRVAGRWASGVRNLAVVVCQVVKLSDYFDHGVLHPGYEAADFVDERSNRLRRPFEESVHEAGQQKHHRDSPDVRAGAQQPRTVHVLLWRSSVDRAARGNAPAATGPQPLTVAPRRYPGRAIA